MCKGIIFKNAQELILNMVQFPWDYNVTQRQTGEFFIGGLPQSVPNEFTTKPIIFILECSRLTFAKSWLSERERNSLSVSLWVSQSVKRHYIDADQSFDHPKHCFKLSNLFFEDLFSIPNTDSACSLLLCLHICYHCVEIIPHSAQWKYFKWRKVNFSGCN